MKVLVLQLARIGDIYQSRQAIQCLIQSGATVHVVGRSRFIEAFRTIRGIETIHRLDTAHLLESVVASVSGEFVDIGIEQSAQAVGQWINQLAENQYDAILNLSFSPLSSWLTFALTRKMNQKGQAVSVIGYTRTDDGYLAIPDDVSAFFYSQVGGLDLGHRESWGSVGLYSDVPPNRLPLSRLFLAAAEQIAPATGGVDLDNQLNWLDESEAAQRPHEVSDSSSNSPMRTPVIAVHIGASNLERTLSPREFAAFIDKFRLQWEKAFRANGQLVSQPKVILLGARHERVLASELKANCLTEVIDLVGSLQLAEVEEQLREVDLLVCADSAILQIANSVGTKSVCFSLASGPAVNLFETGPTVTGSFAVSALESMDQLAMVALNAMADGKDRLFHSAINLNGQVRKVGSISDSLEDLAVPFALEKSGFKQSDPWLWNLRLYFKIPCVVELGSEERIRTSQAVELLKSESEVLNAMLAVHQAVLAESISVEVAQERLSTALQVLDAVDAGFASVVRPVMGLCCLLRWKKTERLRIGPNSQIEVIRQMLRICEEGLLFCSELIESSEQAPSIESQASGSEQNQVRSS